MRRRGIRRNITRSGGSIYETSGVSFIKSLCICVVKCDAVRMPLYNARNEVKNR